MIVDQISALTALVDALDPDELVGLDDAALHDVTIQLHRLQARVGLVAAQALAVWEPRGIWAADQSRTSTGRLARELRCAPRTARTVLRRARRLGDLPATVTAVAAGTLSPDHIDLLAGAQAAAPEPFTRDEAMLVAHCQGLSWRDAEQVVAYWRLHTDPDGTAATDDRAADSSTAHASETLDGTVRLDATLDPISGVVVHTELRRLADLIRLADLRDGVTRTAAQRLAAALVEMATRSASTPAGAQRPRPLFTALIGDDTLTRLCELSTGRVTSPGALAAYIDTAVIETVLFDGPNTVVAVSHKRTFTGALRRAIEVRDRHCMHPSGCDIPADRCDIDHIIPWPQSHRTDQGNGRLECPTHNRNADRHDINAIPRPVQHLTGLDAIRARARWWCNHGDRTNRDPDDPDADPGTDPLAG